MDKLRSSEIRNLAILYYNEQISKLSEEELTTHNYIKHIENYAIEKARKDVTKQRLAENRRKIEELKTQKIIDCSPKKYKNPDFTPGVTVRTNVHYYIKSDGTISEYTNSQEHIRRG